MNQEWYNFVYTSKSDVFRFARAGIPADILQKAAKYFPECFSSDEDGKGQKKNTMDALIATYSLKGGHYLMTTNESHFPASHFSVIGVESLTLSGNAGKRHRKTIYLLKPITQEAISLAHSEMLV